MESENVLAMRHFVGLKLTVLPITGHDGQDPVRAMKSPYRWPASLESLSRRAWKGRKVYIVSGARSESPEAAPVILMLMLMLMFARAQRWPGFQSRIRGWLQRPSESMSVSEST